jgi:uncharacterized membrane protein YkvA (DUF1232 family)
VNGWTVLVSVVLGIAVVWVILIVALLLVARRAGGETRLRDVVRLVPDVVRLIRRLVADDSLPRGVRVRLGLLLTYLLLPVDLVPDFIPVVGWADDAIVVALALRSVVKRAGEDALDRHWPGTAEGLTAVKRLTGLPTGQPTQGS